MSNMPDEDNSNSKILLIDSSVDLGKLKEINSFSQIIAFDYDSHQLLNQNNIPHKISDNYLTENDLDNIENNSMQLAKWYQEPDISKFLQYSNINIGELFYVETYYLLIRFLKKYLEIKFITKNFQNSFFYTSSNLFPIVKSFTNSVVQISGIKQDNFNELIEVPLRIGGFDLPFKVNKYTLSKIRGIPEFLSQYTIRSQINKNNKTILLYNVTTHRFSDFYSQLPNFPLNIVRYDTIIPAIWNYKTYSIIKKSGCILENYNSLVDKVLEKKISQAIENFTPKLNSLPSLNHFFQSFFQIDNSSFWDSFRSPFLEICNKKFYDAIKEIEITKKLFEKYNFSAIMLWTEVIFQEQILLNLAKQNGISVIFSQHGFEFDTNEMIKSMNYFRDFPRKSDFAIVWGNMMKEWFVKNGLDDKKIKSLGSPYFSKLFLKKFKFKNDYVLLACDGKAFDFVPHELCVKNVLAYKNTIKKICEIVTKLNKKLVIKPHPSKHSNEKEIAMEVNKNIQVIRGGDILPLIPSSSIVITTNITTAILEVLILKKPVVLIRTHSYYGKPSILHSNGCIEANIENLESILKRLLYDKKFKEKSIELGNKFLSKYLVNHKNSSREILKFLVEENLGGIDFKTKS